MRSIVKMGSNEKTYNLDHQNNLSKDSPLSLRRISSEKSDYKFISFVTPRQIWVVSLRLLIHWHIRYTQCQAWARRMAWQIAARAEFCQWEKCKKRSQRWRGKGGDDRRQKWKLRSLHSLFSWSILDSRHIGVGFILLRMVASRRPASRQRRDMRAGNLARLYFLFFPSCSHARSKITAMATAAVTPMMAGHQFGCLGGSPQAIAPRSKPKKKIWASSTGVENLKISLRTHAKSANSKAIIADHLTYSRIFSSRTGWQSPYMQNCQSDAFLYLPVLKIFHASAMPTAPSIALKNDKMNRTKRTGMGICRSWSATQ